MDRSKAFEVFRKSYRKNEAMEENRQLLKEQMARGKQLGMQVAANRDRIKQLTNKIEQIRRENALRGMVDENGEIMKTPEEEALQVEVSKLKIEYQNGYTELKELKAEIERIDKQLERCKETLQRDFEQWLSVMLKQQQNLSLTHGSSSDPKVNENLEAFYQMRDEIYKGMPGKKE